MDEIEPGKPMKYCAICCLPIPEAAKKCTHCDSFQDARQFIQISNTTLSLIVAFIAVITAALPVIKSVFTHLSPKILVVCSQSATVGVSCIGSNSGNAAGFVTNGFIKIPYSEGQLKVDISLVSPPTYAIVKPGEVVPMSFKVSNDLSQYELIDPESIRWNDTCSVRLASWNAEGLKVELPADISCREIQSGIAPSFGW